ncbi:MAG: crotonase/enoyl-CoA hydratase family protein [Microscillaceae bacterium]|nr:crotonase/enoyl-CoA hydratase family protein [Microscillaceae bacterium]MDW8461615.1 crotonase/enoyl-CoA hydratase family protein [Cytophagales bacterium]
MNTTYQTLLVELQEHVAHVKFNNPQKSNAMGQIFWTEIKQVFQELDTQPQVRVVVVSAEGKNFSAGIDLIMLAQMQQELAKINCEARKREHLYYWIRGLQNSFSAIEQCRKPVLAAIHGACVGAGVDFIAACDMRYATEEAFFCIKETDLAIVADVGTFQRLRGVVSEGLLRELAFTARTVSAHEAKSIGLVNQVFVNKETMLTQVIQFAQMIAQKSPITIRGIKHILNYSRNHTIEEGLNYVATWNAAVLLSQDLQESVMAVMQKRAPQFEN